jgi:hypothetical protein
LEDQELEWRIILKRIFRRGGSIFSLSSLGRPRMRMDNNIKNEYLEHCFEEVDGTKVIS